MAPSAIAERGMFSAPRLWLRRHRTLLLNKVIESLRWRLGLRECSARISAIEQQMGKLDSLYSAVSTWAVTSWVEQAQLEGTPLVSVVLPTHNRSRRLLQAVASIVGQKYENWEIVIVDDGSSDETPAVINRLQLEMGEGKFQAIRISQSGVCAARNHGLRAARGQLIAYLDDDNAMHCLWLKAVVWAFSQYPDIDVVYGGIIVDDLLRVDRKARGALPAYYLHAFDRERLIASNLADIGVIAHRSGLPEAHFDETLREMGDWDLLLRLTRERPPLVLPVLACFYSTDERERLSGGPTFEADEARVRQKAQA